MLKKCKDDSLRKPQVYCDLPIVNIYKSHRPDYRNSSRLLMTVLSLKLLLTSTLLTSCGQLPNIPSHNPIGASKDAKQASSLSNRLSKVIDTQILNFPEHTQTLACQDITPNQTITVTGHLKLAHSCHLQNKNVRFILNNSNTSLDCNGATMSVSDGEHIASAITIKPKTDTAIRNIDVANCHTINYGHALHIRQHTNPNERYQNGFTDPDANRAQSPNHIRIVNVSSIDSKNSGIFVGDHVHHVTFDSVYVARSGTVGLYFEFGSQNNTVINSVFMGNGFRTFKPNREAIAVDASSLNHINNNKFIHNGAGGVHLYRNCFEHADDPSRSNYFKRTESASHNIIENNTFSEDPVGVWVASRQSRNLKGFECGAYLLAETPFARYHIDSAKNNKIINNTFIDVDTGIIIEDDGTQIIGNDFTQIGGIPYKMGSEIRQYYADNVEDLSPDIKGTVFEGNKMPYTLIRTNN